MDPVQIDSKQFDDFKSYMERVITTISSITELGINGDSMYHLDAKFDEIISSLNRLADSVDKMNYALADIKDKVYYINNSLGSISSAASDIDTKIHS